MSQELDSYFLNLSLSLERGNLDFESAVKQMVDNGICERADGENIKILIRTAFMTSLMNFGNSDITNSGSYWIAKLAYELSKRLNKPDINFTLEIGIGNAQVCSAFALQTLLEKSNQIEQVIPYLIETLPILKEDEDIKGYLENLISIGTILISFERYKESIKYFKNTVEIIEDYVKKGEMDDLLDENCYQDMVRIDNKNTYRFSPNILMLVDIQLIQLVLYNYLSTACLHSKNIELAFTYSSKAFKIWKEGELMDGYNPMSILAMLHTYTTILAQKKEFKLALSIGKDWLQLANQVDSPKNQISSALLLALCYQELGDNVNSNHFRALASEIIDNVNRRKK